MNLVESARAEPLLCLERRSFLKIATAAIVPAVFMPPAFAGGQTDFWSKPRRVWLQRRVAGRIEEVNEVYFADGQLLRDPYIRACRLLRDVRAGEAVQMSPVLLDILCGIQGVAIAHGIDRPLITNSGYRSPKTNSATEGAAKNSLHMQGRAWDGRMPDYPAKMLAQIAQYLQGGGVGLYVASNFCHVDDGRLRIWRGA